MRFPFRPATFLLTSLLLAAPSLLAQAPAKPAPPPSDRYAGESYIIDHLDSLTVMNPDGTGYRQRSVVVKIQSDAALRELGVVSAPFASASEHVDFIYVRVRRPDGTVSDTPLTDALEQPEAVTREAPMYSDLKEKQLPVKNLRVGDTLEWQARITRTKAEAPGQFWGQESFTEGAVIRSETVELRVPKGTAVTVWTNPKSGLTPTESDAGTQHIYHWEHSALKPTTGKEADAEKEARKKKLWTAEEELDAREGTLPSLAWTTFKSWDAVGAWFRALEADRTAPDDAVKAKVAELTAGKSTEEEKVRALYNYVSTQIRYIGVDLGVGRYQPHHASDVLENQYGDCKDKQTLLAAMLHVLGIQSDAVLIGVGIRFNQAVPSPSAFNHVITHFQLAGQPVWLDATPEVSPFRMLMYGVRDKQVLVIPETGVATIARTPAKPAVDALQTWTAIGSVDTKGVSDSHITITLRGDEEIAIRQLLRQVSRAQYDEFVQRMSGGMGYSGTTSHATFLHVEDPSQPLAIDYDYHRIKGGDWEHSHILPQLAPVDLPFINDQEPPVQSITLGVQRTETSHSEMKLPAGWGVELPEAVHQKTDFATYDTTYKFDKGTLIADRTLVVLKERVPATDWKIYKKFQDAINLGNETYIDLTQPGVQPSPDAALARVVPNGTTVKVSPPVVVSISDPEAEKLIQQAFEALNRHDLVAASPLIDKANDLNPQQKGLWGAKGFAALQRGDTDIAIADYKKEVTLHPDSIWAYEPLVRIELLTGKHDDALTNLQAWADADSANPVPATRYINQLLEDGKFPAAAAAAKTSSERLPEEQRSNEPFQISVAKAQLKAGMSAEGIATFKALIATTDNPETMNTAAYELADNNQELPLAESTVRTALDKLTAESNTWTLDESPVVLKAKSSELAAAWDTLGWILFREGKPKDALDYVDAAWHTRTNATIGEHLGDVHMALGQYTLAVQVYGLAGATIPPVDAMGVRRETDVQKALNAKAEKARKAGGKPPAHDARWQLNEFRTLSLGPAKGHSGYAEYRILIANNRVERVEPTGPTPISGGADMIQNAALPHFIPTGCTAKLARTVVLTCHSGTCDLILEP